MAAGAGLVLTGTFGTDADCAPWDAMKTTAAVLVELGRPLELADLAVPVLKPGQVLVEVAYSGVCHTQVGEARGHRGEDRFLPHGLGHEGSGVVREVGPGVAKVRPGDRVILSWIKGSGADVPGTVYDWNGRKVNAGGITTFATRSVISENRLTVVPDGMPLRLAALVGCAVPTGAGVIFNTARPRPGQSVAVFGVGGIGSCAVAAAALAGCTPVIAVDVNAEKLALARRLGATHAVNSKDCDPVAEVRTLCPGGAAVVVGNARFGERLEIDPRELNQGKRLLGTWGGDNVPDRDYPRYCKLMAAGRLDLEPLLSRSYRLADVNAALDDLERGCAARPLLDIAGRASAEARAA